MRLLRLLNRNWVHVVNSKYLSYRVCITMKRIGLCLKPILLLQMDILMFCLQIEEIPEHDQLKRSFSRDESISKNFKGLSIEPTASCGVFASPKSPIMPPTSPPASSQHRYHPYEEIYIPPKRNAKPQIMLPQRKSPRTEYTKSLANGKTSPDSYSTDL